MVLFAEITADGWVMIIGALANAAVMVLGYWRLSNRVGAVADQVEVVRHATNSLTDRLVAASGTAGETRGAADERAREAARRQDGGGNPRP